jgi:hypothetical protein
MLCSTVHHRQKHKWCLDESMTTTEPERLIIPNERGGMTARMTLIPKNEREAAMVKHA